MKAGELDAGQEGRATGAGQAFRWASRSAGSVTAGQAFALVSMAQLPRSGGHRGRIKGGPPAVGESLVKFGILLGYSGKVFLFLNPLKTRCEFSNFLNGFQRSFLILKSVENPL